MNRLSFLRALGATLAAVPLGLLAAKKNEPEADHRGILAQMADAPERTTPADGFESTVLRQRQINAVMSDLQHKLDSQAAQGDRLAQETRDDIQRNPQDYSVRMQDSPVCFNTPMGIGYDPTIRFISLENMKLIYDSDGYPRIVKA